MFRVWIVSGLTAELWHLTSGFVYDLPAFQYWSLQHLDQRGNLAQTERCETDRALGFDERSRREQMSRQEVLWQRGTSEGVNSINDTVKLETP